MPPAVLAAGLVAGGTLGGAMISSHAASKAADAQAQAASNNLAFQENVFNWQRGNFDWMKGQFTDTVNNVVNPAISSLQPFVNTGTNAAGTLAGLYGWNGVPTTNPSTASFLSTPDYNFALSQGMRALDMSAAAGHTLTSGGMVRAAQDYGQQLAGLQYGNAIQRLIQLMGLGSNAAGTMGGLGTQLAGTLASGATNMSNQATNTGANVGGAQTALGQAQASGIIGAANPFVNALNTGPGNALAAYAYMSNPMNGLNNSANWNPSSYFTNWFNSGVSGNLGQAAAGPMDAAGKAAMLA